MRRVPRCDLDPDAGAADEVSVNAVPCGCKLRIVTPKSIGISKVDPHLISDPNSDA